MAEGNWQALEQNPVDDIVKQKAFARSALSSIPKYDGKSSYRQFFYRFNNWFVINNIGEKRDDNMAAVPDIEFHKQTLLYCMEGNAVE